MSIPQSMLLSKIRKIMYTPINPRLVGLRGQNYIGVFSSCLPKHSFFLFFRLLQLTGPQGKTRQYFILTRGIAAKIAKGRNSGSLDRTSHRPHKYQPSVTSPRLPNSHLLIELNKGPTFRLNHMNIISTQELERLLQMQGRRAGKKLWTNRNRPIGITNVNNDRRSSKLNTAHGRLWKNQTQRRNALRLRNRGSLNQQVLPSQYRNNRSLNSSFRRNQFAERRQRNKQHHYKKNAQSRYSQPLQRKVLQNSRRASQLRGRFNAPVRVIANQPKQSVTNLLNTRSLVGRSSFQYDVLPSPINRKRANNTNGKNNSNVHQRNNLVPNRNKTRPTTNDIKLSLKHIQDHIHMLLDKLYFEKINNSIINQTRTTLTDPRTGNNHVLQGEVSDASAVKTQAVPKRNKKPKKQHATATADQKAKQDRPKKNHAKGNSLVSSKTNIESRQPTRNDNNRNQGKTKPVATVPNPEIAPEAFVTTPIPKTNNTTEFLFTYPGSRSVRVRVEKGTKVSQIKNPDGTSRLVIIPKVQVTTEEPPEIEAP